VRKCESRGRSFSWEEVNVTELERKGEVAKSIFIREDGQTVASDVFDVLLLLATRVLCCCVLLLLRACSLGSPGFLGSTFGAGTGFFDYYIVGRNTSSTTTSSSGRLQPARASSNQFVATAFYTSLLLPMGNFRECQPQSAESANVISKQQLSCLGQSDLISVGRRIFCYLCVFFNCVPDVAGRLCAVVAE
jgi:hypothetical protein